MQQTTKHSYLPKASDDYCSPFVITFCGQHLPADSESALWIEEFGASWQEQPRSDLCRDCAKAMNLQGAN